MADISTNTESWNGHTKGEVESHLKSRFTLLDTPVILLLDINEENEYVVISGTDYNSINTNKYNFIKVDFGDGVLSLYKHASIPDGNGGELLVYMALPNNLDVPENLDFVTLVIGDEVCDENSEHNYLCPFTDASISVPKKPVVIWESGNGVNGLTALNTDMSSSPTWQITGLDMTPYSYIKVYSKSAQKSGETASASTTAAMVLEISLDSRAAGPYGGHYIGSVISQKPNDASHLATLTCIVSADKTSFSVLRMTSINGTTATSNADTGAEVFKIVGYYD